MAKTSYPHSEMNTRNWLRSLVLIKTGPIWHALPFGKSRGPAFWPLVNQFPLASSSVLSFTLQVSSCYMMTVRRPKKWTSRGEFSKHLDHHARNNKAKNIFDIKKRNNEGVSLAYPAASERYICNPCYGGSFHFGERWNDQAQTQTPTSRKASWYPHGRVEGQPNWRLVSQTSENV